ncbi:hypothetical protein JXB12_09675 [candidate division KSB1 bacterium]|nr:hypothetical protein [candidate division KSB1 bacterium]
MRRLFYCFILLLIFISSAKAQFPTVDISHREQEIKLKEAKAKLWLASENQATENQQLFDVKYYSLDLVPDPVSRVLTGQVQIDMISLSDQLDRIELNFYSGMKIERIYLTDHPSIQLNYQHSSDLLVVYLDRIYLHHEFVSLIVSYNGRPQESRYHSFGFGLSGDKPMIWTLSEPFGARAWWPCKDVPADKADSVDIRVTVPKELIVASNGTLRDKVNIGDHTVYWWHEEYPIATYLVSLAIHPYKVYYDNYLYNEGLDTMQIHFYVFPENYSRYKDINSQVKDMIRCFADLYGEYPFINEKYAQADFLGGGAMEHQTCSSFGFWGEIVYAHELAHQWWGDLITCDDFQHIWLNEGFATYSEALWYEHNYGVGAASYYQMTANLYLGDGTIFVEDPLNDSIFDGGLSYSKASWVLHMLRHIVGDSTFFSILRTYYDHPQFKYGSAKTEDFQRICEEVSGRDLSNFFQQWIYDEHYPEYRYYWLSEMIDEDNYRVYGVVNQVQTRGPVFDLPIDLTIKTDSFDTTLVLDADERSEAFEYFIRHEPRDVILDQGNWVLKRVEKIRRPDLVVTGTYIDHDDNSNRKAEPGETIDLYIDLKNQGLNVRNLRLQLSSEDPCMTITQDQLTIDEIVIGTSVNTSSQPFRCKISSDAASHLVKFTLNATGDPSYNQLLTFYIAVGYPTILFVDDDEGDASDRVVCKYLNDANVLYDTWSISEYGVSSDLSQYKTLFWTTGDARTNTLTPEEQLVIGNFLEAGGNVFISGQNIGYDLVAQGTVEDSLFYATYLKSQYIADSADDPWIVGTSGDELGRQLYVFLIGNYGSNHEQESTDIIAPIDNASSFLTYSMIKQSAGIYATLGNGARMVYVPFGIEGIAGPNPTSATMFVSRIVEWLSSDSCATGLNPLNDAVGNDSFVLYNNFPNPFNPETTIQYAIPQQSRVLIRIYNLVGEQIITLVDTMKEPGEHRVIWNGKDQSGNRVPSGLYLYKLDCIGSTQTKKMLLLK